MLLGFRRAALALLSVAAVFSAAPASAKMFQATYTGLITSSDGDIAAFDALAGRGFTLDYFYDDSLGTFLDLPGEQSLFGDQGSTPPTRSPITRIEFRVGDFFTAFMPTASTIDYFFGPDFINVSAGNCAISLLNCSQVDAQYNPRNNLGDINAAFASGGPGSGTFRLGTADAIGTLTFKSRTLNIVEVAAGVPEPQTWAMLIAGFGMIGIAARRRRFSPVTAA